MRVLPIGDSLTQWPPGWRVPLEGLAPGIEWVGSQVDSTGRRHEGHGGWNTIQLLAAPIEAWVAGARPDIVLLLMGTNDVLLHDVAGFGRRIETIVRRVRSAAPGARVIVQAPPAFPEGGAYNGVSFAGHSGYVNAMGAEVFNACHAAGAIAVPTTVTVRDLPATDVHPLPSGYAKIAQQFARAIARETGATGVLGYAVLAGMLWYMYRSFTAPFPSPRRPTSPRRPPRPPKE